jgi:O-antigen ligase
LGGFALVFLAAPMNFFLNHFKQKVIALMLFTLAIILIALTFSRSAWLGLGAFALTILFHFRRFERKRLVTLGITSALGFFILAIPLRQLFFTRVADDQTQTEQVSTYTRLWLIERTWEIIQGRPMLGVGVGNYSLALSQHVADFYDIEPVHNTPLLIMSELGIGGAMLMIGLAAALVKMVMPSRNPVAIILLGALVALATISFFDHYLWTLAPGQMLFAAILGLRASQLPQPEIGSDHSK